MKSPFKNITLSLLTSLTLVLSTASFAADTEEDEEPTGDWQTYVQMDLDNSYYESALERLEAVEDESSATSADWNNFMGYTLRQQDEPNLALAETYYKKALVLKEDHKGALEYYGELKLLQKDLKGAKELMVKLQDACPEGCDELDELYASVKEFSE